VVVVGLFIVLIVSIVVAYMGLRYSDGATSVSTTTPVSTRVPTGTRTRAPTTGAGIESGTR